MDTFVCVMALAMLGASSALPEEKRLTKHLLDNYERVGRYGRPVANNSEAMEVKFGMSLQQITNLDFRSQSIELNLWLNLQWTDQLMRWDEKEFNVHSVRIPPYAVFVPDIIPYNAASSASLLGSSDLVVYSDGTVNFVPPIKQSFSCNIPTAGSKGTFECDIKYGSWTYDGSKLNLTSRATNTDLSSYRAHPSWTLVSAPAVRTVKKYECCPEPYIDITFKLKLKYNK